MNKKEEIIQLLKRRGRVVTTDGQVIQPPVRQYPTIPEEIIGFLNEVRTFLSSEAIAYFLGLNPRSVKKALTNLFKINLTEMYMSKRKEGRVIHYSCNLPVGSDVSSVYSLIRASKENTVGVVDLQHDSKLVSFKVERTPFRGTVLFEHPVLLTFGIDESGQNFKTAMTPLPLSVLDK